MFLLFVPSHNLPQWAFYIEIEYILQWNIFGIVQLERDADGGGAIRYNGNVGIIVDELSCMYVFMVGSGMKSHLVIMVGTMVDIFLDDGNVKRYIQQILEMFWRRCDEDAIG